MNRASRLVPHDAGAAVPVAPWRVLSPTVLVALGLFALYFGTVTLAGTVAGDEDAGGVRLSYAIFGLLGVVVAVRGRLVRLRPEMMLFFAVTTLSSVVAYFVFAPQLRALITVLISLYVCMIGASLGAMAGDDAVLRALRVTSLIALGAIIIKDVIHAQAFLVFLANPNGHPIIPTFTIGGPNLEATWVAMAGLFFIGSPVLLPYVAASVGIGVVYASRVGIIIAAFVLMANWIRARTAGQRRARQHARRRLASVAILLTVIGATSVLALQFNETLGYVADRFQNIGDEPGSLGRLTLWTGGARVFAAHPFGVGQGNAVPELKQIMGVDVPEDNLHNLYLQYLVETGLPGLFAFLVFAVVTWRRLVARRFQDRVLLYMVCYLLIATLQFSGGEFLVWYIYGLHTGVCSAVEVAHAA